jgi:hypothetical protein
MNSLNMAARDYLILPTKYMDSDVLRVADYNGIALDAYLFDSLHPLFEMSERTPLLEAAYAQSGRRSCPSHLHIQDRRGQSANSQ